MQYLGGISGSGVLMLDGKDIATAYYDFDGFLRPSKEIVGCGEIRLAAQALKEVFGRANVQIRTVDGRLLNLKFSEKTLNAAADAASVDVSGDLPSATHWRR
jgi:hypothetical protein